MKIAVFILLGYLTCTLRCEVNKREAENKTKIARNSDTLEPSGNIKEPVDAEQPGQVKTPDASEPPHHLDPAEDVMTIDAVEPPDDAMQPQNADISEFPGKSNTAYEVSIHELFWKKITTLPVDTKQSDYEETIDNSTLPVDTETQGDSTLPVDSEQTDYVETTDNSTLPDDTETKDYSTLPVDSEQTDYVETTDNSTLPDDTETKDDSTLPVNTEQPKNLETSPKVPEDVKITTETAAASKTTNTVYGNTAVKPATKESDIIIQAYDTGPAKIKVVDALKILEMSKNKYALESVALIHRLEWLRSTYNVTELVIDHKVDVHDFDKISDTNPNILRDNAFEEAYAYVKGAVLNATHKVDDAFNNFQFTKFW